MEYITHIVPRNLSKQQLLLWLLVSLFGRWCIAYLPHPSFPPPLSSKTLLVWLSSFRLGFADVSLLLLLSGSTDTYCGTGCDVDFGECNPTSGNITDTTDGLCGSTYKATCANYGTKTLLSIWLLVSITNWRFESRPGVSFNPLQQQTRCKLTMYSFRSGSSDANCGTGCQEEYGTCN